MSSRKKTEEMIVILDSTTTYRVRKKRGQNIPDITRVDTSIGWQNMYHFVSVLVIYFLLSMFSRRDATKKTTKIKTNFAFNKCGRVQ